jgi:hypothetical protein
MPHDFADVAICFNLLVGIGQSDQACDVPPNRLLYRAAKPGACTVSKLPLFSNMRVRCPRCGGGPPVQVGFCWRCAEAYGDRGHYHRRCDRCEARWVEQTRERRTKL